MAAITNDDIDTFTIYDYDFELKEKWAAEAAEERRKAARLKTLNASTLGRNPAYVHNASIDERLNQIGQAAKNLISQIDNKEIEIKKIAEKNRRLAKQQKLTNAALNLADMMFGQEKGHTVKPLP
jgi:hypothetical protein